MCVRVYLCACAHLLCRCQDERCYLGCMSPMHYSAFQEGKNSKQLPAVVNGKSGLTSRLFVLGGGGFSEASQLRMLCIFTCATVFLLQYFMARGGNSTVFGGAELLSLTSHNN